MFNLLKGVTISQLHKTYDGVSAVNDVSMEIKDKEFVVLLGPSGCGKTTTLRCVAGLETPDSGDVHIGDINVNDLPPKDRDVAMVFQSYALYPHMTVRDNISFPLKMKKVPKIEIEKRVKKVSELLQISKLLERKPKQLSGGEAQRVALGRAIIREPRVFLMDEPLSNLDAKLRLYMRAELKKLQSEIGITTIYVTHDQAEAMTMADRIAVMNDGTIQQFDTPDVIYKTPSNQFVSGFIGSPPMNLVECVYQERDGVGTLDIAGSIYNLNGPQNDLIKSSNTDPDVIFGARPEHVAISTSKTKNAIEAEVYVLEPLGSEVVIDLKIGESIIKSKLIEFSGSPGEKVWLTIDQKNIRVFDKKTGNSIV